MPSNETKVDHVEQALRQLSVAESERLLNDLDQDHTLITQALAESKVHSNLAIAEELKGIREAIGDYLGDGSNADHIVQALRAIAEPTKYGIEPR